MRFYNLNIVFISKHKQSEQIPNAYANKNTDKYLVGKILNECHEFGPGLFSVIF